MGRTYLKDLLYVHGTNDLYNKVVKIQDKTACTVHALVCSPQKYTRHARDRLQV